MKMLRVAVRIAILVVICILDKTQGWIQSASFSSASSSRRRFQRARTSSSSSTSSFMYQSLDDHKLQNSTIAANGAASVHVLLSSPASLQLEKEVQSALLVPTTTTNSPNNGHEHGRDHDKNENNPPPLNPSSTSDSLGDIMHSLPPPTGPPRFEDGLVTSPSQSLSNLHGITDPLDRMAITANGNLQRLYSSYYDAPVRVVVDFCLPVPTTTNADCDDCESSSLSSPSPSPDDKCWDRRVHLTVHGQTFCTADSFIRVHDVECQALVESGLVGLGQLFRYLDILPEFALLQAGPTPEGGCWRKYTLSCKYVTCHIQEVFVQGSWKIEPVLPPPQIEDNEPFY
jgi:hypothetical protein